MEVTEFPSSMGGGRVCAHGDTCSPNKRIFVYGHRIIHTHVITAMQTHMAELHCRKLNQWQGEYTWQTSLEVIDKENDLHIADFSEEIKTNTIEALSTQEDNCSRIKMRVC